MNAFLVVIACVSALCIIVLSVWTIIEIWEKHNNFNKILTSGLPTFVAIFTVSLMGLAAITYFYTPKVSVVYENGKDELKRDSNPEVEIVYHTDTCKVKIESEYPGMLFMDTTIERKYNKLCGDLTPSEEKEIESFKNRLLL